MITTNGQLYQWDVGRIIEVSLLTGENVDEIHIYNGTTDCALILDTWLENNKTYAKIPDSLLQSDNSVDIYAVRVDEHGRRTVRHKNETVLTRGKPDDYIYTEEEVRTYAKLEKRIEVLEKIIQELQK